MAASQKEYSMLIKLGAQLGREFGGTFSSAQKILSDTQREVRSLQKTQADISSYQKQQQSIDSLKGKLAEYEREMTTLSDEIKAAGGFSQDLANKELALKLKMDNTTATIREKSEAVHKMGVRLTEAGVDTATLTTESERLGAELEELKGQQEKATEEAKAFGNEGSASARSVGDALAAAGIAVLLKEITQAYGECIVGAAAYADEIGTVSAQYGIAADDLQAYYYAAELVDVSVDTLTSTMARNVRAMAEAKDGAAQYKEAYETLGVSVTNADGSLRDSEEVYWDVIDALGQMENASERDAIAMDLLGRSAQQINTLIAAGSGVMDEYTALAKEAGYIMDEEVLAASMALDDELQIQKKNFEALKNTLGTQFAPAITEGLKLWNGMLAGMTEFANEHPVISKLLVGLGLDAAALAGVYGTIVTVKKAHNTVKALSTALTAKETAGDIAHTAALGAQTAATNSATGAQTGLNAAMMANPIILGVTAVAIGSATLAMVAFTEEERAEIKASEQLTATFQQQQRELQDMNTEYERLCSQYGESSYQAQELSWEIEEATAAFDENKQTIAEYRAEFDATMQDFEEMRIAHADMIREMSQEEAKVFALIERLGELSGQTNLSAASQQEMLAIIRALNEEVEGLGLSYDSITRRLSMTKEEIIALAEVDIKSQQYDNYYKMLTEDMSKKVNAQEEYNKALANEAAELENLEKIQRAYEAERQTILQYADPYTVKAKLHGAELRYTKEYEAAEKDLKKYQEDAKNAANEIADAEAKIEEHSNTLASLNGSTAKTTVSENLLAEATAAVGRGYMTAEGAATYYGVDMETLEARVEQAKAEQEAFAVALKAVRAGFLTADEAARAYGITVDGLDAYRKITELTDDITSLSEAYNAAYERAYDSLSGQYDIWDKAAEVIPADIAEINTALETQQAYWHDYGVDLESLQARAGEIEGLSDVIATFADGSQDSVNKIAGLAQAGDEELRAFVENWKAAQSMMQGATGSVVEFQVSGGELAKLQAQLASEIKGLNLDAEAGAAAKATMDAYIQALKEGGDEAAEVARELATQIGTAINQGNTIRGAVGVPTVGALSKDERVILSAYASGTKHAASGFALVGENGPELVAFDGGERVYTAKETTRILEAQIPHSGGGAVITLAPQFILQGVSDDNLTARMQECADTLIDLVVERLDDMGMDARRSAYV